MMVRAKFQLQEITINYWDKSSRKLVFRAAYDTSIPEDQRFFGATPTGEFSMLVNNPKAIEQLELGKYYYFDISEASHGE